MYCPCGTGEEYSNCCGIYISGQQLPLTPEKLMRSRYTAYYLKNLDYIANTMRSPAANDFDINEASEWAKKISWIRLEVIKTETNSAQGFVEFRAYYTIDNKKQILHEKSEFRFQDGQWYYVDGEWQG